MFQPWTRMNRDGTIARRTEGPGLETASALIGNRRITHLHVLFDLAPPRKAAQWQNAIQRLAEETRLGIPVTLSSDPRHGVSDNPGAGLREASFSRWPEPIGLGAIGDVELVRAFAETIREEYRAVGLRLALHPMADLASDPRWARTSGTFGSDPRLVAAMTQAYIEGLQLEELGRESVACMTKHFPGGGAQEDGEDPHFAYGKNQVYPGGGFDLHLEPFLAALRAGTAQVMPYYGLPIGVPGVEEVGFGFNRDVITGLLRESLGFDGVVCTDWKLLTDEVVTGGLIEAKCWGVEHLSLGERIVKALDAGVDQFGGEHSPKSWSNLCDPAGSTKRVLTPPPGGCFETSSGSAYSIVRSSTPLEPPLWSVPAVHHPRCARSTTVCRPSEERRTGRRVRDPSTRRLDTAVRRRSRRRDRLTLCAPHAVTRSGRGPHPRRGSLRTAVRHVSRAVLPCRRPQVPPPGFGRHPGCCPPRAHHRRRPP